MAKTEYTEEFETFWKAYPKRWNRMSGQYYKVGKWEAFQVWKRLSNKDKADILLKVKYMRDGEFVLDAHRWLKKRRFDDIEIPKTKPKLVPVPAKVLTPEEARKRRERLDKIKHSLLKKIPHTLISESEFNDRRNKALKDLKGSE